MTSKILLRTVGVVAAELKVPLHRILHVLATRPHIQPAARAGRLRLYDRTAVGRIRCELQGIESRRKGKGAPHG
ncbi:MAG: hypothetical protein ACRDD1_00290 [Planctomycetia bacterium]